MTRADQWLLLWAVLGAVVAAIVLTVLTEPWARRRGGRR